jgi:hypothetical protein
VLNHSFLADQYYKYLLENLQVPSRRFYIDTDEAAQMRGDARRGLPYFWPGAFVNFKLMAARALLQRLHYQLRMYNIATGGN